MSDKKAILEAVDLRTWFPIKQGIFSRTVGNVRAVDGVDITVNAGETLGLVGESGCGKTTFARTVMGLDPAKSGSIMFQGNDLLKMSHGETRKTRQNLQMIFQDPFSSLNPRMSVMDIITEGIILHKLIKPSEKTDAAEELLKNVGMDGSVMHRYPHEFSGGQRQRISIARSISLKPKLILCDEAVSALDVSVQAQVINLLMELKKSHDLSYLFISHDLSVVGHISDRIAVMYLGQVIETGSSGDIIANPAHPYTRALISAIPVAGAEKKERTVLTGDVPSPSNPPKGCRFHPRCPNAKEECRSSCPALEPLSPDKPDHLVSCLRKNEI